MLAFILDCLGADSCVRARDWMPSAIATARCKATTGLTKDLSRAFVFVPLGCLGYGANKRQANSMGWGAAGKNVQPCPLLSG